MTMFSVRVSDDLARRFDAAASTAGGRSARLRQLISAAAVSEGEAGPRALRTGARLMVRLSAADAEGLDAEAHRMGLRRAAWVAALVRRRVRDQPTLSGPEQTAVLAIQGELRRIGVNLNQIARALNTAVIEGRVLELELAYLDDLRGEIRGQLRGLRESLAGNLAYWEISP